MPPFHWLHVLLVCGLVFSSLGASAQERALNKEIQINASLEQAWQAWTTREGIVSFFAPDAHIEARVGGAFQIYFDPGAPAGAKGADDMRYLALQPHRMLTFDWNAPPHLPEARQQRTFVVVRLAAVDDKTTRVTLHHTGWGEGGEWDKTYAYFDRAWGGVLNSLKTRFETGPVNWAPWLKQLEAFRAQSVKPAAAPASQAGR